MKSTQFSIRNNRGQGTIEYILLLVVVVGVILGAIYQLNSAFRVFADNYFGEYLACLLETGELPSMGGGSTSGECNQVYAEFSIEEGKPFVGVDSSDDSTGKSDNRADSKSKSSEAEDSSSGGTSGGSIAQSTPALRKSSGRSNRMRIGGDRGLKEINASEKSANSGGVTSLEGYQDGKAVRIPIDDLQGYSRRGRYNIDDEEKGEGALVGTVAQDRISKQGPQLIRIDRKVSSDQNAPDIEPFSFGYFLRYLLIAIVIIAIIVFIGGQIMQLTKSME